MSFSHEDEAEQSVEIAVDASLLLSFRAENVRSFRDGFELSMLSTSRSEPRVVRRVAWREGGKPIGTLPVAGIFGANASGKTNVLRAMDDMRDYVRESFRSGRPTGGVPRRAFRLDPEAERRPSSFEVDLVVDGIRHVYGFEFDDERFISEWAFRYPKGRPSLLFRRNGLDVELGSAERSKGRAVRELLRPNALFLSTAASANHALLLPLYEWFDRNLLLAESGSRNAREVFTARLFQDPNHRAEILALLQAADLGITGVNVQKLPDADRDRLEQAAQILAGEEHAPVVHFVDTEVKLAHRGTDRDVEFDAEDESQGTMTWFGLVGPIVDALAEGSVLLADELDASLHPALVQQLVRLFQDPETNPRRAQLIFNSHDTNLMGDSQGNRALGRDQVWFSEKLHDGSSRVYPLSDLDPRKDEAIARRYLSGRYGGVPLISSSEFDRVADLISTPAEDG